MSETTPEATPSAEGTPAEEPARASWDTLFDGEDPEKVREALNNSRKWEARAKENFEKAAKFDELERASEANLSDLEKAQKAAKDAEEAAAKATAEALRLRVAAKHGISDEDADLFLTGLDAETLEKQAERLVARTPKGPKPDPTQGARGGGAVGSPADSFAEFFRNNL